MLSFQDTLNIRSCSRTAITKNGNFQKEKHDFCVMKLPSLRKEDELLDEHVSALNNLHQLSQSWEKSSMCWLDDNIISGESKRYVSNFTCFHCLRPADDEEEEVGNFNALIDDENVYVTRDTLEDVFETHVGGNSRSKEG